MILVTHDLAIVEQYAEQIAIVYAGETVEAGATEQVLRAPRHPYTEALLAARPQRALAGERLLGIPGTPPSPAAWPPGWFAPRCDRHIAACDEVRPPFVVDVVVGWRYQPGPGPRVTQR